MIPEFQVRLCARCSEGISLARKKSKYCSNQCQYLTKTANEFYNTASDNYLIKCARCLKSFTTFKLNQLFCSSICRKTMPSVVPFEASSGTIGAVSELIVAADLLQKQYEVFRSVSPTCSCDIVINHNGDMKRVEVKTGRYSGLTVNYSKFNIRADIVAVVTFSDNKIHYFDFTSGRPLTV